MSIQEALITMFTDDPINWLKWAVVFAILIGGYAVAVPLYKKPPTASAGSGNGISQRAGTTSSKRLWRTSIPPAKYPAMIGTPPTTTRWTERSGSTPPILSIHRHRPCTCISIMSMILTSCFPVRSTTTKTIRQFSCSQSFSCPGSWPASPSSSWA